ncbi:MAG: Penicillin-binding protein 2 [Parcubacteria group bacterium Athens0714_24]|nr:MAG: Penicillin-binding protein 2 [Parcubacteria group bacterium Athens0714_24]
MFFRKRPKIKDLQIYPDEIFLDSKNIPKFDTQQFEGRLEKPISKKTFFIFSSFLVLISFFYFGQVFNLQVLRGQAMADRSQKNNLKKEIILPPRTTIADRDGVRLAWTDGDQRNYIDIAGFSHIIGYLGLPSKEDLQNNPGLAMNVIIGKEGVEKKYEEFLRGNAGVKLVEFDSQNNIISESVQTLPVANEDFKLTIDSGVQAKLFEALSSAGKNLGYKGGAGTILDVNNGEVLALASYPEYKQENISDYLNAKNNPFLNRAISGLYAPGSIVKPFIALAALNENIISPDKQIFSSGSISIPNPFFPDKKNIFLDWKAHGWTDMKKALAVSSDVYFYEIGGGYQNQKGLGISKLEDYAKQFGMDSKTGIDLLGEENGVVPDPELKARADPRDPIWRVGDTYNASIGQGYFQVTPIEMAVFAAALANNGIFVQPHLAPVLNNSSVKTIDIPKEYFDIVREGMLMAVKEGTATTLNVPGISIAAKTGTAQVGANNQFTNSWVIGFFPYENPKYAFAVVTERGPKDSAAGAQYVMRQILDWLAIYRPEYLK